MDNRDFRLVLPGDILDREFFKKSSWDREWVYDYSFEFGKHQTVGFGTAPPWAKYATFSEYFNEDLGLRLRVVDYFDLGPAWAVWYQNCKLNPDPASSGIAIYLNGKWAVKKLEEELAVDAETEIIGQKTILKKIIFKFIRNTQITVKLEIVRED